MIPLPLLAAASTAMIQACAPNVAPPTIERIIHNESGGNALAVNINKPRDGRPRPTLPRTPRDAADAVSLVTPLIEAGYSIDLGLMQVNSKNLPALGFSVAEMFQPCTNITAGALVLSNFYSGAVKRHGPGQRALLAALSAYNTGDFLAGFKNGYVARYTGQRIAAPAVPAVNLAAEDTAVYVRKEKSMNSVFNNVASESVVFSRNFNDASIPGVVVEVDPDEAGSLGAFAEDALSAEDAWDSNANLDDAETTPAAVARGQGERSAEVLNLADARAAQPNGAANGK
jgi:type IV secretion system protein VirB1